MTIRLLCDARGAYRKPFVERLLGLSEGKIELALQFGDRDVDFHALSLQRMQPSRGLKGHLMETGLRAGAHLPMLASPDFRQMVETAVDQLHRMDPAYSFRPHNLRNLQDYLDYYHILADRMAAQIEESGITHALFFNVPHLGYDTILYQVARALGVPTLVFYQTIFPNRFFSMWRVEDLGTFDSSATDAPPFAIEKGSAPDLFYMDDRWQKPSPRGRMHRGALSKMLRHLALHEPARLLSPAYVLGNIRRMRAIYGALPDWRDPFAKFFHTNELAYFEHLAEFERAEVDLSQKYVYVPLHNQPELSSSALGGPFRDQLLMIEALSRHLPEDWLIYVKENPRQGAFARGPMFFHRLTSIRGVRVMPSDASTHALSDHAQLVASVTSTAGWEAIRKGRPAVVFGNAWYKSLPGVHPYAEGLDLEAIAASRFDHAELERAVGALIARCHEGVIETVYQQMAKDLDNIANADAVGQTAVGLLLERRPVTFG